MVAWHLSRKPVSSYGGPQLALVWSKMFPRGHSHRGRDSKMLAGYMRQYAQDSIDIVYAMLCYRNTAGPFDVPNFLKWHTALLKEFNAMSSDQKAIEIAAQISQLPVPVEVWIYLEMKEEGPVGYRHAEFDRARKIADEFLSEVLA